VLWVIDEQLTVYRQGASYAQAFSGSYVDFGGNEIELLLALARQIGAIGQVLADLAVGVSIGAALPRAVRVAEVHRDAGGLGGLLCDAISGPWSLVMLRRSGRAMPLSLSVKAFCACARPAYPPRWRCPRP